MVCYAIAFFGTRNLSEKSMLIVNFIHALLWRVYHTFVLGYLLRAQSQSKFLVRHFHKHYHYPVREGERGALQEAFTNWKSLYNLSMSMAYGM